MPNLTAQCAINSTIDPSCDCLASGGAPQRNMDISGLGVRISFYLQTLFLTWLSVRSRSVGEITGSLYTLVATNVGMAVTAFILGFKPEPDISLQDAIVVSYLLFLSWVSLSFSLASYNRLAKGSKNLKFLSVLQSYVLFAFAFAILSTAEHFGRTAPCNSHAVLVIFSSFRAIHKGNDAAWVFFPVIVLVYSVLIIIDYNPEVSKRFKTICRARKPGPIQSVASGNRTGGPDNIKMEENDTTASAVVADTIQTGRERTTDRLGISGKIIVQIIVIFVLWALTVMNTELLIIKNKFSGSDSTGSDSWQFGQILPMFLIVIPLINVIKAFYKYKLEPRSSHNPRGGHNPRVSREQAPGHTHDA